MGEIVGATLCAHVPRLMMSREEKEQYMGQGEGDISTLDQALEQMYEEQIEHLDFNTFLIFDTHWYSTKEFLIDARDWHSGFYTSDEVPTMIHDYMFCYLGDPELAHLIVEEADQGPLKGRVLATQGGDSKSMGRHYPSLVTMHYLNPERKDRPKRAILPMSVGHSTSIQNELNYGGAIARAIERSNRRVVLVATGGLSHKFHNFDDIPAKAGASAENVYSDKHRKLDLAIVKALKNGDHNRVLAMAEAIRKELSPEGHFAHYLRMVAALGGKNCTIPAIQYGKYETAIGTGQVVLWFPVRGGEDARNS